MEQGVSELIRKHHALWQVSTLRGISAVTGVTSGGEMRQAARCLAAHGRCGMQQTVSGRDVNLLRLRQRQFPRNERESNGRVRGVRKLCGFAQRETRRCKQRLYLRLLKGHTTGCSLAVPSVVDRRLPILLPPYPATTRISGTMSRAMLATPQRTATPRIARFTLCNFCISLSLLLFDTAGGGFDGRYAGLAHSRDAQHAQKCHHGAPVG